MLRSRLLDALETPLPIVVIEAAPGSGKRTLVGQWMAAREGQSPGLFERRVLVDARRVSTDGAGYVELVRAAAAREHGLETPPAHATETDLDEATRFFASLQRPTSVAVLDADYLEVEAFELLLRATGGRVRFILVGFDLSALVAFAQARRLHFVHLDDSDLECNPDETRELMLEGGLTPSAGAVAVMQEITRGHPGMISAAVRALPVESASGQVSSDRVLAAFLAATPFDRWPSPFGKFVVSLIGVSRFSAEEAGYITGAAAAPALLHRLRALGLGTMVWNSGLQSSMFHWSEAIRSVLGPLLREMAEPDEALLRRVVVAAERCGDTELQVATALELGELSSAERMLGDRLWEVLPDRGSALWRPLERIPPRSLLKFPGLLCIRLRLDPVTLRSPESAAAARQAARMLLAAKRRGHGHALPAMVRAMELMRLADDHEAFVQLAVRVRDSVMQFPTVTDAADVEPGAISDLLVLVDTLLRGGSSTNAAVVASHVLRLIDIDPQRLDATGERRLLAGRVMVFSSRERGLDDPLDPEPFLTGLQFLRHDTDFVAATLALLWADLDAGNLDAADARCHSAIAAVANVADWPILSYLRACLDGMQGRAESVHTVAAHGQKRAEGDDSHDAPTDSGTAWDALLSQIVGEPIRHPEFIPFSPAVAEQFPCPRGDHATALIEALTSLRAGRRSAAVAHLGRAIATLPGRSLSTFSLARANGHELEQLAALIEDHPLAARLNIASATVYGRIFSPPAFSLSEREREVLDLIRDDATNAQMATKLYVSVNTVRFHRANLMRKLGASNRAELLDAASLLRLQ